MGATQAVAATQAVGATLVVGLGAVEVQPWLPLPLPSAILIGDRVGFTNVYMSYYASPPSCSPLKTKVW